EKFSVGHLRQPFGRAAHADETFDFVVIRLQVAITERPVLLISVAAGGVEFVVAIAVALTRPAASLPAHLTPADPHERLVVWKGARVFVVVHGKLGAAFDAGVAKALDEPVFEE